MQEAVENGVTCGRMMKTQIVAWILRINIANVQLVKNPVLNNPTLLSVQRLVAISSSTMTTVVTVDEEMSTSPLENHGIIDSWLELFTAGIKSLSAHLPGCAVSRIGVM